MHVFLETERVVLRRFTVDDVELLLALDNDPAVMRYINGGLPMPRAEIVDETIPAFLGYYDRFAGYGFWAAIERDTGRFIGWFHFRPGAGDGPRQPELGYRLHTFAWGSGVATEVSAALIDHGFTVLDVERVRAETMAVNVGSRRVMEKVGCVSRASSTPTGRCGSTATSTARWSTRSPTTNGSTAGRRPEVPGIRSPPQADGRVPAVTRTWVRVSASRTSGDAGRGGNACCRRTGCSTPPTTAVSWPGSCSPGSAPRSCASSRPAGSPAAPARRRAGVVGVQPGQAERRVRDRTTSCSSWCATPTCCSTAAASFDPAEVAAINPGAGARDDHARSAATGRRRDWAASDLTIARRRLRPGAQRRQRPGPGAHGGAPGAGCTPAPRRPSARCSACTERERSGLGQHVDVSAQQAVMQAGIPGVLLAPNDNPEAQRTVGRDPRRRPCTCSSSTRRSDGYVSITLLFGTMIGPFSRRLMEWVHEEGHCDAAMRDWDWDAFGLRLVTTPEGPDELEQVKAAITATDELDRPRPSCSPRPSAGGCCWRPVATAAELVADEHLARPRLLGRRSTAGRAPARSCRRPALAAARCCPAATGGRRTARGRRGTAGTRPRRRSHRRRRGRRARRPQGRRPHVGVRRTAGHARARRLRRHGRQGRGTRHPDASRAGGGALRGDLGIEGSVAFAHFNCGKLGLSLDLTNQAGREVLRRPRALGRRADRVVHARRDGGAGASATTTCGRSTRSWS